MLQGYRSAMLQQNSRFFEPGLCARQPQPSCTELGVFSYLVLSTALAFV